MTVTAQTSDAAGRVWRSASVLSPQADGVGGVLFTPPPGTPRHPAVLAFGGAEGGMSQTFTAALLAAHGYPALTIAYFDWPGLPSELHRIPLEYFTVAGQILARQPGTDPAHILVLGYSRGTEAALLLADNFLQLFHGAIVYSPSSEVNPAQIGGQWDYTQPAWTPDGQDVGTFPFEPIGSQALEAVGGTRAGDVAAQRDSWAKVLGLLAGLGD